MKKQKNDWYVWGEWPGIPWFHWCSIFGLALELSRRSGVGLSALAADNCDGIAKVYLLEHEWQEGGVWYLEKVIKNPKKLERDLGSVELAADNLFKLNRVLSKTRPEKCSIRQIVQWCERFHRANHELWSAGMVPNLLELNQGYLSSYLRKYIEQQQGKEILAEHWQTLIAPINFSSAQKEERAFLRLAAQIEQNPVARRALARAGENTESIQKALQKFPVLWKKIIQHHKQFCWIQYGWTGPATSLGYYVDLLARFVRQGKVSVLYAKTIKGDKMLAKQQRALQKSLRLDPLHTRLLILLRRLLFDKAYRMDALYKGYYTFEPMLREIAKRFSLSMNQLYMVYLGDLAKCVKRGEFDISTLNTLRVYSAYIKEGSRLRFYVGEEAKKKMTFIHAVLPKVKAKNEARGECGYPGKTRGIAKLIDSAKDMHKMEKGNILISHATDPSLLPAMKKAAAFVTDLGGLTAHAAIVARELKKPCVIGTKIATKVFRDGDYVEVDAAVGIVKKIKD